MDQTDQPLHGLFICKTAAIGKNHVKHDTFLSALLLVMKIMDRHFRVDHTDRVGQLRFHFTDPFVVDRDRIHVDHSLTAQLLFQLSLDPVDHFMKLIDVLLP